MPLSKKGKHCNQPLFPNANIVPHDEGYNISIIVKGAECKISYEGYVFVHYPWTG